MRRVCVAPLVGDLSKLRAALALPPKSKPPGTQTPKGVGMSRTQDTILIGGVPTRPLQETVPQSRRAAGLLGASAGGRRRRGWRSGRCDDAGVWWKAARKGEHLVWGDVQQSPLQRALRRFTNSRINSRKQKTKVFARCVSGPRGSARPNLGKEHMGKSKMRAFSDDDGGESDASQRTRRRSGSGRSRRRRRRRRSARRPRRSRSRSPTTGPRRRAERSSAGSAPPPPPPPLPAASGGTVATARTRARPRGAAHARPRGAAHARPRARPRPAAVARPPSDRTSGGA